MHLIECRACRKPYDVEQAEECSCLQPVRSFRCPSCAACFCSAGKHELTAFWSGAPAGLWRRRRNRPSSDQETEVAPEQVLRPMVLFADDDPVARELARAVISALGFRVAVAANGEAALEMARRYKPEMIVTDALMPRIDGRELSRIIKQEMPATRVVVISGVYVDRHYKHEALKIFAVDDYLNKPLSADDLRSVVQKHLKAGAARPPR